MVHPRKPTHCRPYYLGTTLQQKTSLAHVLMGSVSLRLSQTMLGFVRQTSMDVAQIAQTTSYSSLLATSTKVAALPEALPDKYTTPVCSTSTHHLGNTGPSSLRRT